MQAMIFSDDVLHMHTYFVWTNVSIENDVFSLTSYQLFKFKVQLIKLFSELDIVHFCLHALMFITSTTYFTYVTTYIYNVVKLWRIKKRQLKLDRINKLLYWIQTTVEIQFSFSSVRNRIYRGILHPRTELELKMGILG